MADWTESDFIDRVKHLTRDDVPILTDIQIKYHLEEAVTEYERRRPLRKVHVIAGDGSTSDWALPPDWVEGSSFIRKIEYPIETSGKPTYLKKERDYTIIEEDDGTEKIRFYYVPTENARLLYANQHNIAGNTNTVYKRDWFALSQLAASLCCEALANYYTQTKKPSVSADVVDYEAKGNGYALRAKDLREKFDSAIVKSRVSVIGDWDMEPSWGDTYIFKGDRR